MASHRKSFRFTKDQSNHLAQLGMLESQVAELEKALPICKAVLSKPATMTEVRERLRDLARPLRNTGRALSKFLASPGDAGREAMNRALLADADLNDMSWHDEDQFSLRRALRALETANAAMERALADLPKAQRRHLAASPFPVQRIAKALLDGFTKHHDPQRKGIALPPYRLRASHTGRFAEVVSICYAAIGLETYPERAIKNYLASLKRRRKAWLSD